MTPPKRMTPEREAELRRYCSSDMKDALAELDALRADLWGHSRFTKDIAEERDRLQTKVADLNFEIAYVENQRAHWRDECEKLRHVRDMLKAENEKLQAIGIANCMHGHEWVSPPVVCPYCENQKLRSRMEQLEQRLNYTQVNLQLMKHDDIITDVDILTKELDTEVALIQEALAQSDTEAPKRSKPLECICTSSWNHVDCLVHGYNRIPEDEL